MEYLLKKEGIYKVTEFKYLRNKFSDEARKKFDRLPQQEGYITYRNLQIFAKKWLQKEIVAEINKVLKEGETQENKIKFNSLVDLLWNFFLKEFYAFSSALPSKDRTFSKFLPFFQGLTSRS